MSVWQVTAGPDADWCQVIRYRDDAARPDFQVGSMAEFVVVHQAHLRGETA